MKRKKITLLFIWLILGHLVLSSGSLPASYTVEDTYSLYREMELTDQIPYKAFEQAMAGHRRIHSKKKDIITVVDFSKPSTAERLFILDLKNKRILYSSHVSHGRNSGGNYAISFSNEVGSFKSSLGFYLTEGTYTGKNGYSLVLDGLEKGINDRAKERAIVIHGADYANPTFISTNGRLGRSLGCPALPVSVNKKIIDLIKGGSLLYIYAEDKDYFALSPILNSTSASVV